MKHIQLIITLFLTCVLYGCADGASSKETAGAEAVIRRTFGTFPEALELRLVAKTGDCDSYTYESTPEQITVTGTSAVALCKGFYDYILDNGFGIVSWTGNRLDLPDSLPTVQRTETVSPFSHHLYDNVCTFGYTYPLWTWEQWEREIDWMAMHGFDMPLAPIAGEAIFARVWREMGLSDEEINEYFTSPLHLPWMRMGNMTAVGGGLGDKWQKDQIALQHKILDRMRSLGMTPVFQGFAGFVPKAMKEHFPEINLTETKWSGLKSYMLSPLDSLFSVIGTEYIKEWEKEFGKGEYYLIDSFNEMDIPFGPKGSKERYETLQTYGRTVYESVKEANPDAVWVMQGWMFGHNRGIWDKESVQALLSGVPDDKMMIIDLAVDFNEYVWKNETSWDYLDGMYGKQWIWSTVPNFGGRNTLNGPVDFYLNGHLEALGSENKGALKGYGTSPEGVENNEIIYELISAAGWSDSEQDVDEFLARYSAARYGATTEGVLNFWKEMRQSAYCNFTNNAKFLWQQRPAYHRLETMNVNGHYFKAIEDFLSDYDTLKDNELYRTDAIQYAALYIAAKADYVFKAANWAMAAGDIEKARSLQKLLDTMLLDTDRLLESHPLFRLQRWFDFAENSGTSDTERMTFKRETRKLLSTWAGGPSLGDYSARVWSGLIRDYYAPRLRHYFEAALKGEHADMLAYDRSFHFGDTPVGEITREQMALSAVEPFADPVEAGIELVKKYSGIVYEDGSSSITDGQDGEIAEWNCHAPKDGITWWCPQDMAGKAKKRLYMTVSGKDFAGMSGLAFSGTRGGDARISRVEVRSGRTDAARVLIKKDVDIPVGNGKSGKFAFNLHEPAEGLEREAVIYVTIEGSPDTWGTISFY